MARVVKPRVPILPTHKDAPLPVPVGGLNAVDGVRSMPGTDCVLLYNMVTSELGLRPRLGYQEFATGVDGGAEIRTVLPYTGSMRSQVRDALFAVTVNGIWDVTSGAPVQVVGGATGVPLAFETVETAASISCCAFASEIT